ncbi:hypothetical protein TNCV_4186511 [Trichonephila clavipes]|nr:hypothetical protein TNCV_4186511 [Trichonephila clavipes]
MDPQPRNLAQLATALESAWLNIPENTFRDLSDSLPARLAADHSAKSGGQFDAKPPSAKLLGTHLSTHCRRDKRLSQPGPARGLNIGPVEQKRDALPLNHWASSEY